MIGNLIEQQIEELLKDNVWGHLGCNDGFNTYIYPINYLYDGKYITCHSQQGFKIQVMRKNKGICLQVDEVKDDKNWKSVMVLGTYQELDDEREYRDAMRAFTHRRLHLKISESPQLPDTNGHETIMKLKKDNRPAIFRIVIHEKTGKFENE